MISKLMISLLFCALTAVAVNGMNLEEDALSRQVQKMNTLLSNFKTLRAADEFPVHSFDDSYDPEIACFDYFLPKSAAILTAYQTSILECSKTAQNAKDAQALANAEKRADLISRAKKVSENLEACESITDTLEFLECYQSASASNSEELYKVSQESGDQRNVVIIKYEEINNDKTLCNSTARRQYTNDAATNDKEMQSCLAGQSTPPTGESTTPTTTTETTTPEVTEETEPTEVTEPSEPTDDTDEPTEETEEPTDEPTVETDEPETEPERSPEEDIYEMSRSAQARRNILKHLKH